MKEDYSVYADYQTNELCLVENPATITNNLIPVKGYDHISKEDAYKYIKEHSGYYLAKFVPVFDPERNFRFEIGEVNEEFYKKKYWMGFFVLYYGNWQECIDALRRERDTPKKWSTYELEAAADCIKENEANMKKDKIQLIRMRCNGRYVIVDNGCYPLPEEYSKIGKSFKNYEEVTKLIKELSTHVLVEHPRVYLSDPINYSVMEMDAALKSIELAVVWYGTKDECEMKKEDLSKGKTVGGLMADFLKSEHGDERRLVFRDAKTGRHRIETKVPMDMPIGGDKENIYCGTFDNEKLAEEYIAKNETHWVLKSFLEPDYEVGPIQDDYSRSKPPIYWGTLEECTQKFKESLLEGAIITTDDNIGQGEKYMGEDYIQQKGAAYLDRDGVLKAWIEGKEVEQLNGKSWFPIPKYSKLEESCVYRIRIKDPIREAYEKWSLETPRHGDAYEVFLAGYEYCKSIEG